VSVTQLYSTHFAGSKRDTSVNCEQPFYVQVSSGPEFSALCLKKCPTFGLL